jgi:prephenate dehydrogenase
VRVAVLGVGLIGGSIGMAARRRLEAEVTGFDPSPATLERALEVGAVDRGAGSVGEAVEGADAVFCAAPVAVLPELVAAAIEASGDATLVTDVGSTKRDLLAALEGLPGSTRFIGGHPLAGAETAGVEGSREDLFEGARWYLTPSPTSEGVLFDRLHGIVAGIGARPQAIDAAVHDREMATISHLPHVLANALVDVASRSLQDEADRPPEVGRSFRDATRVAGANPPVWGDIFSSNAEALAAEIDAVVAELEAAAERIRGGSSVELAAWQDGVRERRRALLEAESGSGALIELRISVENRPGTVAGIALALGRAGVNIEDMSLFPAADRRTGAISLWVAGRDEAHRAAGIVAALGHKVAPVPAEEA